MDAPKHAQIGPQRGASPFTGVAMDLAFAVPIVIAGPLTHTMAHGPVPRVASRIAIGLIGIAHRAPHGNVRVNQFVAGLLIGMVTDPEAVLATLARNEMNDWRAIIGIGAAPGLLISAPPWRIGRVAMGRTFFPAFW